MLKKIFKYMYWTGIAILIIPVSKYYFDLARDYIAPLPEKTYAKGFVFTVPKQFLSFFSVTNDLEMDDYDLRKQSLNEQEKNKLLKRIEFSQKKLAEESSELDAKLMEVLQRYPDAELKKSITSFIDWKKQNKYVSHPDEKNSAWFRSYKDFEEEIYNRLRELSGIYNIKNPKDAYVMSVLPEAIDRLKANPNDPKLCSVMSDYNEKSLIKDSPMKIAQSIAFVEHGNKYCEKYYNKRESWGILGKKESSGDKNYVPYEEYYKTKVVPLIPKALAALESENVELAKFDSHPDAFCDVLYFRGLMHKRNSFNDAKIVVAKQKRPDICVNKLGAKNRDIDRTGYSCLQSAMAMCAEKNYCDAVEICKPFNDPLFEE